MAAHNARQKLNSIYGNNPTANSVLSQTATMAGVGALKLAAKTKKAINSLDKKLDKKLASVLGDKAIKFGIYWRAKWHYGWNNNGRVTHDMIVDEIKDLIRRGKVDPEVINRIYGMNF